MSSEEQKGADAPPTGFASAGGAIPGAIDKVRTALGGSTVPPALPPPAGEEDDDDGMLRMSFMEHLEELRSRIFKALIGVAVAAVLSLTFCNQLWDFVRKPASAALTALHYDPELVVT